MNNVKEVLQVISIGLIVAGFLLNTSRYLTAIELCKECLIILKDRAAIIDENFTTLFYKGIYCTMWKASSLINDNTNAVKYAENILLIYHENGERLEECRLSLELAEMYFHQCKYPEAIQLSEKALLISRKIGDRKREAQCRVNLGGLHQLTGEYKKAREHLEKSLAINTEIGDRKGEGSCYTNLGNVHKLVGDYEKAREHLEKSLAMQKEIGDRKGEAMSHAILGNVYTLVGDYEKAKEHLEKSLAMQKETGDRNVEALSYLSLGEVYAAIGEYEKALDYLQKSLVISEMIGHRPLVAKSYRHLGAAFYCLGKYSRANEYYQKALFFFTDIGDRVSIASVYLNRGAREHFEKVLAISKETGNKVLEAAGCSNLGGLLINQAEYEQGEKYIEKALVLSETVGDIEAQLKPLQMMAYLRMKEGKIQGAISYFLSVIEKSEEIRGFLRDNDQFKISFSDHNIRPYKYLSMLLCVNGNPSEALYVSELSKARALADLMAAQYSMENQILANPRTLSDIDDIVAKNCNRTCLCVSYHNDSVYLWILRKGRVTHFQRIEGNDIFAREGSSQQLEKFFECRSFGILPEEICEDRSLHSSQPESKSNDEHSHDGSRLGKESNANRGPKMNIPLCYKLIIAPVVDFLEGPEIIIVPDRALYQIPFAALTDESGKYLTETFRIRMVPSLTTLKLINESPGDYHCQTGALIVGNPDVGEVHFKGKLTNISRLPCAENEAEMIAEKLGVEPLLGQQATKQAVL